MMQRILVATHGKSTAEGALRLAYALAKRDELALDVLTVLPPLPTLDALRAPLLMRRPELKRECEDDLIARVDAQIARVLPEATQMHVVLANGRPARTIAGHAARTAADLVILGLGRYAPADRAFGGELALEVARWCAVPVLAVEPTSTGLPHRAVAATDFSQSSMYAARTVLELLDASGRFSLVHVCADVELPPDALQEWRKQYGRIADALLERAAREIAGNDAAGVEREQLIGDPVREILAFANRVDADLIAAGSHGYRIAERILVGSVATRLLRASRCSVLLAPPSAVGLARESAWQTADAMLPGVL